MESQPRIIIAVYCLVEKDGKVLLVQDIGKEGWKLPGGKLNQNETIYTGAKREVFEEVGLEIELNDIVSIQEYREGDFEHRIRFYLRASVVSGHETLQPGEIKASQWFSHDELSALREEDFFIGKYYRAVEEYLTNTRFPLGIIAS